MNWNDFTYKIYKIKEKLTRPFRGFLYGMKNIISFAPIIWNDRNWDYSFFFYLMRKKLQRMEKCIRNGGYVGDERDANKIKLCLILIDRIVKDQYFENAEMFHKQKWNVEFSGMQFIAHNATTKDLHEIYMNEMRNVYVHSDYMQKQDLDFLFRILTKNIMKWWT